MVLVTGASGMIGGALARLLAAAGVPARLHDRSVLDFAGAQQAAYDELVQGCETVVHCAALVHDRGASADRYEALNVRPTAMLLDAAARAGVRSFVFLSSTAVYGAGPFEQVTEEAELRPATPYAASKVASENDLRASAIAKRVVLRPALVFGEGDRGNLLSLLRAIDAGRYVHVSGNAARKSLVCAADVAQACLRCLASLPDGWHVLNVANRAPVGVVELGDAIALALGRSRPRTLPAAVMQGMAAAMETVLGARSPLTSEKLRTLLTTTTCSIERLAGATGFIPAVPLEDALAAEVRWARSRGLLHSAA